MSKMIEGLWLFSTILQESLRDILHRLGIVAKKEYVVITCPFEGHPEPRRS
jgi:hypothetical protein